MEDDSEHLLGVADIRRGVSVAALRYLSSRALVQSMRAA